MQSFFISSMLILSFLPIYHSISPYLELSKSITTVDAIVTTVAGIHPPDGSATRTLDKVDLGIKGIGAIGFSELLFHKVLLNFCQIYNKISQIYDLTILTSYASVS